MGFAGKIGDAAGTAGNSAIDLVKKNPKTTVGVAGAVGGGLAINSLAESGAASAPGGGSGGGGLFGGLFGANSASTACSSSLSSIVLVLAVVLILKPSKANALLR